MLATKHKNLLFFLAIVTLWQQSCACGKSEGKVELGDSSSSSASSSSESTSFTWSFTDPADYEFDANTVEISNSLALFKPLNQTSNFASGSKVNADYNLADKSLSMADSAYNFKFPDNASGSDWFDMTGNVFLFHLDQATTANNSTVAESSGNEGNGTFISGEGLKNKSKAFRYSNIMTFDGVDDYINLNALVGTVKAINQNHSLSLWFKDETAGERAATLISISDSNDAVAPFEHAVIATGDVTAAVDDEALCFMHVNDSGLNVQGCIRTGLNGDGHRTFRDGRWHHLVVSVAAGSTSIFIDGISQTLSDPDVAAGPGGFFFNDTNFNTLSIGTRTENLVRSDFFKGSMAEVALMPVLLNATSALDIYHRQAPFFKSLYHLPSNSMTGTQEGWVDMLENKLHYSMEAQSFLAGGQVTDGSGFDFTGLRTGIDASDHSVSGVMAKAYEFDGSDDCIYTAHDPELNILTSDSFTISIWSMANFQTVTNRSIVSKWDSVNSTVYPFHLEFTHIAASPASSYIFTRKGATQTTTLTSPQVLDKAWHHIMIVGDATNITMYFDGEQVDQQVKFGEASANSDKITLGCNQADVGYEKHFSGKLDEFAIWKRAFSISEVRKVFYYQSPVHPASYSSSILDAESSKTWQNVAWSTDSPYSKALLPDATIETGYLSGNTIMTGNVLLWHMDDTSTTIADASGAGLDGTYDDSYNGTKGKISSAIGFDGNSTITLSDDDSLDFDDVDFSIAFWFRNFTRNSTVPEYLVHKHSGTTTPYEIFIDGAGTFRKGAVVFGRDDNAAPVTLASNRRVDDGLWHHVAFVKSGSVLNLYIDGLLDNSKIDTATGTCSNAADFTVGVDPTATDYFEGQMDELAVWSRALNAGEIHSLFSRASKQLKIQLRSCDDLVCAGETYEGPTGDASSFFTENQSSAARDTTASIASLPANQYLQYKVFFESMRLSEKTVLKSLNITPLVFPISNAQILTKVGIPYSTLDSFLAERQSSAKGAAFFQLSYNDGNTWMYFDGIEWQESTGVQDYSTDTAIAGNLESFNALGTDPKRLKVRIILSAAGVTSGQVSLDNLSITYTPSASTTE